MNDTQTGDRILDRVKVSKATVVASGDFVAELHDFEITFYSNGQGKVTSFGECSPEIRQLVETGEGKLYFDADEELQLTTALQARRSEQDFRAAIADDATPSEIRRRLRSQLYGQPVVSDARKLHQVEERRGYGGTIKSRPLQALNKPHKPQGMTGRQFRNWRKRSSREARTRASTVNANTASI